MSNKRWSEWVEWSGGECPVPSSTLTEYKMKKHGSAYSECPELLRWSHDDMWSDIIAYRYKLPDETLTPEQEVDAHKEQGLMTLESTDEEEEAWQAMEEKQRHTSDGSTASYYELPPGCTELQHLISYRNMNAQDGEIFRAIYRKGRASHSDALRDARKVLFYAQAEVERLEKYCIG